jgi:hypothetical protein
MQETATQQEKEFPEDPDDQFKLAEELSTNPFSFPNVIDSRRFVRLLRIVRKHAPITEGKLANLCEESSCMPRWQTMIQRLCSSPFEFIKLTPTGHGRAVHVSLTERGEEWCKLKIDPKPVQPKE